MKSLMLVIATTFVLVTTPASAQNVWDMLESKLQGEAKTRELAREVVSLWRPDSKYPADQRDGRTVELIDEILPSLDKVMADLQQMPLPSVHTEEVGIWKECMLMEIVTLKTALVKQRAVCKKRLDGWGWTMPELPSLPNSSLFPTFTYQEQAAPAPDGTQRRW